jgi:hypothetical protein
MDLKTVDYAKLYKENLSLKNFEEPVKIGSDSERYSFRFTKGDIPEDISNSSIKGYLESIRTRGTSNTEFPSSSSHMVEIIDNTNGGKRAAHITYDPISGFIHYRGTEKAYQNQGLSTFLYNKAASFTRIRHSGNLTPQGRPTAIKMGGFMAYDDVFGALSASSSTNYIKRYLDALMKRSKKSSQPQPSQPSQRSSGIGSWMNNNNSTIGWQNDRLLENPEYDGVALSLSTRQWFQNPFRTSNNFPYGPNGSVEPAALSELERIRDLERQSVARQASALDAERARSQAREKANAAAEIAQYNALVAWRKNPNRT